MKEQPHKVRESNKEKSIFEVQIKVQMETIKLFLRVNQTKT